MIPEDGSKDRLPFFCTVDVPFSLSLNAILEFVMKKCWNCHSDLKILKSLSGNEYCEECGALHDHILVFGVILALDGGER